LPLLSSGCVSGLSPGELKKKFIMVQKPQKYITLNHTHCSL
jgi:hypothetical protein